jgi:hypothetical protein
MKTNSTFKMSKDTKRRLSLFMFKSVQDKNIYKKLMIQAQLFENIPTKTSKNDLNLGE